ncbi:MAG TPA: hypothetical protein VNA57_00315 [Acidimicrobiales bacterium]|nr:hypothetical protein [Acidimicrobiales bacterium]
MSRRRRLLSWLARALVKIGIDAVAWAAIQSTTGYGVHRLTVRRLDHDTWVTRRRRWERGGAFYVEQLRIRRWKGLLPEAGAVFAGGFDKGRLGARSADHLRRHVIETRRAEIGHWLALLPTPLFWRWNPRWLALVMTAYAAAINGPCIVAQRYNRLRLQRVLERLESSGAPR